MDQTSTGKEMTTMGHPYQSNRSANQEEKRSRKALQTLREKYGVLFYRTPHGVVDLGSTASLWGEGANVTGFRWARGDAQCATREEIEQAEECAEGSLCDMAELWAETQSENED
jgi:hypothetical protein